ncbi:MAG: heavy metal-associated domain-containing protein [Candidatus Neomarinimicrobiota bacterium]
MNAKVMHLTGLTALVLFMSLSCGRARAKTVDVAVNTAVCEMCAEKIQKAVTELEGVRQVNVDLETHIAQVTFDAAKTDLAAIETAITGVGYSANDKPADPSAYDKLSRCCRADGAEGKESVEL